MSRVRKGPPTPHPHNPEPAAPAHARTARATRSGGDTSRRLALPSDLPDSLQFLDDDQLDTLLHEVEAEARRRGRRIGDDDRKAVQTAKASPIEPAVRRKRKTNSRTSRVTPGQATIIRAAFEAGVKPSAIARQFRIARTEVERIVGASKKGAP